MKTSGPRWKAMKRDVKNELIRLAKRGPSHRENTTTYINLLIILVAHGFQSQESLLQSMLGEIDLEEVKQGRGMLSALVYRHSLDMLPPQFFFDTAHALGRDVSNLEQCWANERARIFAHYTRTEMIH